MKLTTAQKKAKLVRLLHVAKGQLMLDDSAYRTLLANASRGKTSSKDMNLPQLEAALKAMQAQGFVMTAPKRQPATRPDLPIYHTDGQSQMIRGLWIELHGMGVVRDSSERALNNYVKKMTGIAHYGWLDTAKAGRVIEMLKQWRQRTGGA